MKSLLRFFAKCATLSASLILAQAAIIPVMENGTPIGTITVNAQGAANNQGVSGNFQATDAMGNNITLAQLAMNLHEDHFNWLQFLTPSNAFLGVAGGTTFVDPQSTGQGTLWADTLPWYWDEVAPPNPLPAGRTAPPTYIPAAGHTELGDQSTGNGNTQLGYADFPQSGAVNTLTFLTCLVSIGPGNVYNPVGGFSWTATTGGPGPGNGTNITAGPTAGCNMPLTMAQRNLVATSFPGNFQQVPEPGTVLLFAIGATVLALTNRRRSAC